MSRENPSAERPLYIELLRAEVRGYPDLIKKARKALEAYPDPDETQRVFTVCTGNRWVELGSREPDPKMLFGEFWRQDELCILFAGTNEGKSVLGVQIGDSISRRRQIGPFAFQSKNDVVLYVDFELTAKQFHLRYSDVRGGYLFSDKFYRAGLNTNYNMPADLKTYNQYILCAINDRVRQLKATVLIIDNIAGMRSGTENAAVALDLVKNIKRLKNDHRLSVLVLAHTPKRNPARPLHADDLQGSKLLINFADSAFAIGKSIRPGMRYLKQIKQRSTAEKYGAENVCLCRITKPRNFLQFEFTGSGHEREHLYRPTQQHREHLAQQITELAKQGHSQRSISSELNIPLTTVNRLMQMMSGI